jgi:hypothetical protein
VVTREKVLRDAPAFIHSESIAPILPLAAGPSGYERCIDTKHQAIFDKGIGLALAEGMTMQSDALRQAFERAFTHGV